MFVVKISLSLGHLKDRREEVQQEGNDLCENVGRGTWHGGGGGGGARLRPSSC